MADVLVRRFRKIVHKFSIIVQLLLGEIPDRSIFSQKASALNVQLVKPSVLNARDVIGPQQLRTI